MQRFNGKRSGILSPPVGSPANVDYVGLSVFEFPAFDRDFYHQTTRSFHDQMTEKYARVAKYQKPIVISECGVTGNKEYQLSWLSGALRYLA